MMKPMIFIKTVFCTAFLAIVLLLSDVCMAADILDDAVLVKIGEIAPDFNTEGIEYSGMFGKTKDDTCVKAYAQYSSSSNKFYCNFNSSNYAGHKYYIFNVNFAPVEGLKSILFQTKGQVNVSEKIRSGWMENRWNNIIGIWEKGDDNSAYGYATFYLNGKKVIDREQNYAAMNFSDMRIAFVGNIGDKQVVSYVDSYNCYYSDNFVEGFESPDVEDMQFILIDSMLYCKENTTALKLSFSNAEARIYSDYTFTELLSEEDTLANGNIVAVQMKNGKIFYYEVKCIDDELDFEFYGDTFTEDTVAIKNADNEVITDETGKSILKLTNINDYSNAEIYFKIPFSYLYDKIEIKVSVNPETVSGIGFMTNLGIELSSRVYTLDGGITPGVYNDIRLIFDRNNAKTELFVNGESVSVISSDKFGFDSSYNNIRLQLFGKTGSYGMISDCSVSYKLNTGGIGVNDASDEVAVNFGDSIIYITENAAGSNVADLLSANFSIYDGFGNKKAASSLLNYGDVVLQEKENGTFQRFFVKKFVNDKLIQLDRNQNEIIVLAGSADESSDIYIAHYENERLTNVVKKDVLCDKINVFRIDNESDKTTKVFFWGSCLNPKGDSLVYEEVPGV